MKIQPQLLSLHQLLKERLFRIPEYQRAYSWRTKQRKDLFTDITKVCETGEPHFLATVVGLRRGTKTIRTNEFQDIEVVDGQQRLTTLVILLKAIEGELDLTLQDEQSVAIELRQLLVKGDDLALVLLQTNHDTSQHCVTYLRKGTHVTPDEATTDADRCLVDAMIEAESFARSWKQDGRLIELVGILKNKLTLIFHEIDNESVVYTVFEVLNSRGLDVSWFDRLKSILMGLAFESRSGDSKDVIDELHRLWRDIYNVIGLRRDLSAETLKIAATLWSDEAVSRPLGEEDSVATLRHIATRSAKAVIDVTEWLLCVVRALDQLLGDRRREGVTRIGQARLLAVAVLTRTDIRADSRNSILEMWERVSFRIYGIGRRDARSKVGDYVRLGRSVVRERLSALQVEAQLRLIGTEFPIGLVVDSLRDTDCYTDWQPDLRYLLFRYEEYLAKAAGQKFDNEQWARIWEATAAESIEHIQPQSKGVHSKSADGIFVHRLGNLLLLPPRLNSKLQNLPAEKKYSDYLKTGLHQAVAVAGDFPNWDRDAVIKREEAILAWARIQWADR